MNKVIRFANEGFKNYKQVIKENDKDIEVEGCYVFINKIIKMALKYDKYRMAECKELGVRNRDKDTKNTGHILDETYVYARVINFDGLCIVDREESISIQPESVGKGIDTVNFKRITVSELVENLKKYEELEKKLRKKAKDKGIHISFFNSPYIYYEAIVDAKDIVV